MWFTQNIFFKEVVTYFYFSVILKPPVWPHRTTSDESGDKGSVIEPTLLDTLEIHTVHTFQLVITVRASPQLDSIRQVHSFSF